MANLKIQEYETVSSSFTFPYNPNTIEFVTNKFMEQKKMSTSFNYMVFTNPFKSTIDINLNGHFSGSTKNSNYKNLVKKINKPVLLKLYFENTYDKFYLCVGTNVQKVPTGNRPIHLDYVANFFCPIGVLFDDDQQDGNSSSTKKNDGDITVPIEKIVGSVVIDQIVEIGDINNNGFKFTASQSGTMTYNLIKIYTEDNSVYITEYGYVEIDNGAGNIERQVITNYSSSGNIYLFLEPNESLNDIFSGGTNISNITPTFYFRNGWSSD